MAFDEKLLNEKKKKHLEVFAKTLAKN